MQALHQELQMLLEAGAAADEVYAALTPDRETEKTRYTRLLVRPPLLPNVAGMVWKGGRTAACSSKGGCTAPQLSAGSVRCVSWQRGQLAVGGGQLLS